MPKQFQSGDRRQSDRPRAARPAHPSRGEHGAGHLAGRPERTSGKPGARSQGHRGWRPEEEAPKRRWSSGEKRARDEFVAGARQGGQSRSARPGREDRGERQPWSDRPQRDGRPARGERGPRADGAQRTGRGERPDWQPRGERPQRGGDWSPRRESAPRRELGPRTERPGRGERPDWRPREDRGERPDWRPREDRAERPARGERPDWQPREERPYTRAPGADRPSWRDRPLRDDRAPREDRAFREERRRDGETEPRPAFIPPVDVVHERLEAQAVAADAGAGIGFDELGLGDNIVRQLAALGATEPFPIQAATIPEVLAGRDVLGRGRTGSGKTIAFGAPLVERLLRLHRERHPEGAKGRSMGRSPRALILAPTRELAQQIDRTVQPIARSVGLFTISIVGGVPYQRQLTGLHRGVDIVIGTPGRIQDLLDKGELDLSQIAISVLDEADHMCDLGFLEPVQELLRRTPEGSQRLLFSATLDRAVESLVAEFLHEPSVHEVAGEDQASSTIHHRVLVIDPHAKRDILKELVGDAGRAIVFSRTRVFAEDVAEVLDDAGIAAVSMHGDLNQAKRNRSLAALSRGHVQALVATDVAARGIHVDDVELVVQADMPDDHKTYLHRAGRTGRAGAEGTVVTVIAPGRRHRMEELLEHAGIEAEWEDRSTPRAPRGDRGERGFRGERGARDFRADRGSRPDRGGERGDRGVRGSRPDRPQRGEWRERVERPARAPRD